MKLIYDGKVIKEILGGNNLTVDECCELCDIDTSGDEYDFEKFELQAD